MRPMDIKDAFDNTSCEWIDPMLLMWRVLIIKSATWSKIYCTGTFGHPLMGSRLNWRHWRQWWRKVLNKRYQKNYKSLWTSRQVVQGSNVNYYSKKKHDWSLNKQRSNNKITELTLFRGWVFQTVKISRFDHGWKTKLGHSTGEAFRPIPSK